MNLSNRILSDITVYMKYAKYIPETKRRETWDQLVFRNESMHIKKFPNLKDEIRAAYVDVYNKSILPSMRSLQFGGKPIEISPNRIYNCAYLPIESVTAFSETMFLLLGGTGVGYSVQQHHVAKLPAVTVPFDKRTRRFLIMDSIEGWADAIKMLMKSYLGNKRSSKIDFDYSDIRAKGARLVTSGGKAPGPQPLKECIVKIMGIMDSLKDGDSLTTVQAHDIICHIADSVLAGGIRRAALIALFSATDKQMLESKTNFRVHEWKHLLEEGPVNEQGEPVKVHAVHTDDTGAKYYDLAVTVDEPGYGLTNRTLTWVSEVEFKQMQETQKLPWYYFQPQRGRANNSISLVRSRITKKKFMDLWKNVEDSGAGEPGFYFTNDKDWGTNPCCEIALRPYQFCNLCEVNVSNVEDQDDLNARVKAAAFIGTLQAGYTDFHYLRKVWQKTTEKDALIGIGMTGIGSNKVLHLDMIAAAEVVKVENARVAKILGINKAARTTTVKPSGTSSLVAGSSSGIHAWHNDYYIRRMRIGKNEAIYNYLKTNHPDLIEDDFFRPFDTAVLSVPQKAPKGSILRHETAMDLLERVKSVKETWIDAGHRDGMNTHNISATISIKEDEWDTVGEWMWKNRTAYNGLSVLPYNGGTYKQAPFTDCTEEVYYEMMKSLTEVDLSKIVETSDETDLKGELACAGGACEIT